MIRSNVGFCGFISVLAAHGPQAPSPSVLQLAYEADLTKTTNGNTTRASLKYDHGSFRIGYKFAKMAESSKPVYFGVYEASPPHVLWSLRTDKHIAWPDLESLNDPGGRIIKRPPGWVVIRTDLMAGNWKKKGSAKQAGVVCEKWSATSVSVHPSTGDRTVHKQTACIDTRTGLILRLDEETLPPAASKAPRIRQLFTVDRIRFVSSIPKSEFRLKAGTTAFLRQAAWDVPLPVGVKRERATEAAFKTINLFQSTHPTTKRAGVR